MRGIVILATMLTCHFLHAQSLSLIMSSDTILLGNSIQVSYVAENIDCNIEIADYPSEVVQGPTTSSSISIIHGRRSSKVVESYVIRPGEVGELLVPSAVCITGDSTYSIAAYSVPVIENPEGLVQDDQQTYSPPARQRQNVRQRRRELKQI